MSNGYFIDEKKEYVITNHYTKRPLWNYMWNETILMDINQFGCGSNSVFDENRNRRELSAGSDNRFIYVLDREDGSFYDANRNFKKLPFTRFCTHVGQGYSTICSTYKDLEVDFTIFAPIQGRAECWEIRLKNVGDRPRSLSVYPMTYIKVCDSNHNAYIHARFDSELGGLYCPEHGFKLRTEYTDCYMVSDYPVAEYEVARDRFVGHYNHYDSPVALENGGTLSCTPSCFDLAQTFVFRHNVELKPGEEQVIRTIVGIAKNKEMAIAEKNRLLAEGAFDYNRAELKNRANQYDDRLTIKTGDTDVDRFVNIWLKRQIDLGKTWARGYVVGSRDAMQDVTSFVQLDTVVSREKILFAMGFVRPNGNIMRAFIPIMRNLSHDCSSWMITAVCQYIKESGDYGILDVDCPYFECDEHGTVLDHLLRASSFLLDTLGEHGLTLWGECDWNDSLNNCGSLMKGESVWLSEASCKCNKELIELLRKIGKDTVADTIAEKREKLLKNIREYGFDKDHFIYGFNDYGEKIGAYSSPDGNAYLNPQTWAVLAEVLPKDELHKLMDYVEDNLQCGYGYVQVNPPHVTGTDKIGRASYFVTGCFENGSVYNHGCAFKMVADCALGRGDEALKTVKYMLPTNPNNPSEASGMEPYAISNMYLGPTAPARVGEAPQHWITGTCGWVFRGVVEYMLGVQADYDGLRINPALPREWKTASVHRIYRDCIYDINYTQNEYNGKVKLSVDGTPIEGNLLPHFTDGKAHKVDVTIG